jgi:hypothetical protein
MRNTGAVPTRVARAVAAVAVASATGINERGLSSKSSSCTASSTADTGLPNEVASCSALGSVLRTRSGSAPSARG